VDVISSQTQEPSTSILNQCMLFIASPRSIIDSAVIWAGLEILGAYAIVPVWRSRQAIDRIEESTSI